jgi:hypothetical protein
MRLAYIGAYLGARYSSQNFRTLKPFNPLLGETFEIVSHKYRFFIEQVSHHPPISAFHCEG